ncbi:MAG: hypothetical protein GY795_32545 [Desulfobacterales bacterium]|nr:hypothetical protein [Desulfobacterales bacterium]
MDIVLRAYEPEIEVIAPEVSHLANPTQFEAAIIVPCGDPTANVKGEGWALKTIKSCNWLSNKVKDWLRGKFQEGETSGRKFEPRDIAVQMRCETKRNGDFMFMRNVYLKWNQVQSFWSHEAKKQRRAGASHASSNWSR